MKMYEKKNSKNFVVTRNAIKTEPSRYFNQNLTRRLKSKIFVLCENVRFDKLSVKKCDGRALTIHP